MTKLFSIKNNNQSFCIVILGIKLCHRKRSNKNIIDYNKLECLHETVQISMLALKEHLYLNKYRNIYSAKSIAIIGAGSSCLYFKNVHKGLFRDVYTKSYLIEHPEIKNVEILTENGEIIHD